MNPHIRLLAQEHSVVGGPRRHLRDVPKKFPHPARLQVSRRLDDALRELRTEGEFIRKAPPIVCGSNAVQLTQDFFRRATEGHNVDAYLFAQEVEVLHQVGHGEKMRGLSVDRRRAVELEGELPAPKVAQPPEIDAVVELPDQRGV